LHGGALFTRGHLTGDHCYVFSQRSESTDSLGEGNIEHGARSTEWEGSVQFNKVGVAEHQLVRKFGGDLIRQNLGIDNICNLSST
jgi:hypothetical protein